jgi:hypothetical protein
MTGMRKGRLFLCESRGAPGFLSMVRTWTILSVVGWEVERNMSKKEAAIRNCVDRFWSLWILHKRKIGSKFDLKLVIYSSKIVPVISLWIKGMHQ